MKLISGILLAFGGGILNGIFPLPMKAVKRWEWESVWLPFTILALIIFPFFVACSFAPHLSAAMLHASSFDIAEALSCGIVVYSGSLMFGLAIPRIGAGLSFALLVGTMNAVGVLVPRILLHPTLPLSSGDWLVLFGVALSSASVALGFWAQKARIATKHDGRDSADVSGAILAVAGGALSGLLPVSMSMAFAGRLAESAIRFGSADPSHASTIVLTLVLFGGAIPNCAYCVYLLCSKRTYRDFGDNCSAWNWIMVLCMGIFYSASNTLWGVAISPNYLGPLGPSIGWALFVGMIVASSVCVGLISGEWKGAPISSHIMLGSSLLLLALSLIAISAGTYQLPDIGSHPG